MLEMKFDRPTEFAQLLALLNDADEQTAMLAGGTDLIVAMHDGRRNPGAIIDLTAIAELAEIREQKDELFIGGTVTMTMLERSSVIQKYAACLSAAASQVGSRQIRNSATVAGNVANAAPAGDTITALAALRACAVIYNSAGEKRVESVADMLLGPGKTSLARNEVIKEFILNKTADDECSYFSKVGSRRELTISKANIAAVIAVADGVVRKLDIALGALGGKVYLDGKSSQALVGKNFDAAFGQRFAAEIQKRVDETLASRASHPYKRVMVTGLVDDLMKKMTQ